jgi:hypothetical protein
MGSFTPISQIQCSQNLHSRLLSGVKVVTTTAHGLPHETTARGKKPDALIALP